MADNENTMELEMNPYDRLIESSDAPVQSPVILKAEKEADSIKKPEMPVELLPLAESAKYKIINISEYKTVCKKEILIEEDLLVPDTYADVENILNLGCSVSIIDITNENGRCEIKGELNLEMMYRSAENYGNNIVIVPGTVKIAEKLEDAGTDDVSRMCAIADISRMEYRIINERKYKVKIYVTVEVKGQHEKGCRFFEGIENERLFLKKENIIAADFVSHKTRESEIKESLLLNDEKIRPVKILKIKAEAAENHRQLTGDKLILNYTVWIRIMYLAEVASKGNLSNQVMFFQGKIDNTQFVAMGKEDREVHTCLTRAGVNNIIAEINKEANGFEISGEIVTDVECYTYMEKEQVADFYHEKEEMTCDWTKEKVCAELNCISAEQTLRESISLQQDSGDELRIIYADAYIVDPSVSIENKTAAVSGKLHLEAVVMNEGDHTVLAKKICDVKCVRELTDAACEHIELNRFFVREMSCDISGKEINLTAQIQANLNIHNETEIRGISNPCIIRGGETVKYYPITIHTVAAGESVWDIGKKYKVSEDCITEYNNEENIGPGKKIIIVK